MNNREQFESWVSDNGKFQRALERKGGIYLLATINTQWEAWQAASKASEQQLAAVVAENAGLKSAVVRIFNYGYQHGHESTVEGNYVDIHRNDISEYHEDIVAEIAEEQTPATDAAMLQGGNHTEQHLDMVNSPVTPGGFVYLSPPMSARTVVKSYCCQRHPETALQVHPFEMLMSFPPKPKMYCPECDPGVAEWIEMMKNLAAPKEVG